MVAVLATGVQTPRIRSVPAYVTSHGPEAIELSESCGLLFDPWQRDTLVDLLGCRDDGRFASFEVAINATRQNGKGGILEGRELASMLVLGDRLVIHSCHEFATAMVAMNRMEELLEEGDLIRELKPKGGILRSHGSEGFVFRSGQRIWYRTRTKGGGRGFSADLVVLDEAMILQEAFHGALLPIVSARSMTGNPQVVYTGSAVDQLYHEHGIVFARVRERGMRGDDPSLAYFEWSAGVEEGVTLNQVDEEILADEELWAQANPALGIRISPEHVANELRSMDARTFAVERLGIGDYPVVDGTAQSIISREEWAQLADPRSRLVDPVAFAFDVSPDRSSASIVAAGKRPDGLAHVEVVEHRPGTGWVVQRLTELCDAHEWTSLVCDAAGPAASLVQELAGAGLEATVVSAKEHANACGMIFDLVDQKRLRHLGSPELTAAIKGAATRELGDAWAWARKSSVVDITPLVACTLALWGSGVAPSAEFAWGVAS